MCTAIVFGEENRYFGRNLDLEYRFDESVIITPRYYKFPCKFQEEIVNKYAIIGTGIIRDNYPLYYDATNEYGLSIAGLNFVKNAYYKIPSKGKKNIAPHELIPYLLGNFKTVAECIEGLRKINIVKAPFDKKLQCAELHWLLSDKRITVTLECGKNGMKIYKNSLGVLTNNPPFDFQIFNLSSYMNLTSGEATNRFSPKVNLHQYSRGMGTIGLPGDLSSTARFVRASFTKLNAVLPQNELEQIVQFFHILGSVEQHEGSVKVGDKYERTQYSSCCDTEKLIYYYTTYENTQITAVKMTEKEMIASGLNEYKMLYMPCVKYIN